ncbi:MAG TPA: cyanophycin synthetase [Polyangiales bacterium]|nr:cyanophycin synthetase [Polyangiales bacterium]
MNYAETLSYLYGLEARGVKPGLARVRRVLALRDHPERRVPSIVVAGTNGKGSVATMIAAGVRGRVGLFTSPHMHRFVERFRIDGRPVAEARIARAASELRRALEQPGAPQLTFFEINTVLAFELFRECDLIVLEVGLGGRLDATNVVTPLVSVICSIALDHTDWLGPTIAHIAREKAGILKPGVPAIVGTRDREALRVITARASRLRAPAQLIDRDFAPQPRAPLPGSFQADNYAVALAALRALPARFRAKGMRRVRWPGRLELLPGAPDVLCDAAHNPHAAAALAEHLAGLKYARKVLMFGAMRDKQHDAMIALLRPHVDAIVFARAHTPRAEDATALAERYGGEAFTSVPRALVRARKLAGKRGLVIACGSIFLMTEVRAQVLGLRTDPLIAM